MNSQKLIILGISVRTAWRTGLDLTCPSCHSQICNKGILRLARTVGNDGTVSGELGDSVKDLGDGVGNAVDDIGNAVGNAVEGR